MPALKCIASGECCYHGGAVERYGKDVVALTAPVLTLPTCFGTVRVYNVADLEKKRDYVAGHQGKSQHMRART